jgi:hypothetical protein
MRIPILILSAASLVALGSLAKADDHLFQAESPGHGLFNNDNSQAVHAEEAPGRGSPWTAFEDEDLGIPSTRTPQAEDPNNPKTNPAQPHCAGCENPALP